MKILRPIGVALAAALTGCASLSSNPEYSSTYGAKLPELTTPSATIDPPSMLKRELDETVNVGNTYRSVAQSLGDEDLAAGGLTLGSGFYGAATTAFNPARGNLLASILAAGTAQAWRTSLRPGERARVYIEGYRSMGCLVDRAAVLYANQDLTELAALRVVAGEMLDKAQDARRTAATTPPPQAPDPARLAANVRAAGGTSKDAAAAAQAAIERAATLAKEEAEKPAKLARLDGYIDKLKAIDAALRVEQASYIDAPYRVARVRRQIESTVESKLAGLAPNYSAALAILKESAQLPSQSQSTSGTNPAAVEGEAASTKRSLRASLVASDDLDATLATLDASVPQLERRVPTRASDAYARMGECLVTAS